ncbi:MULTISPECIES: hypothetical protein [Bacillus cereus group]|nr:MULTISPECIES: hypothetical protein [Bacillus cereus group]
MTVQQEKVTRRILCRKCKSDQIVVDTPTAKAASPTPYGVTDGILE